MVRNYIQTGGARIGKSYWFSINLSYPCARLDCCDDGILLKIKAIVFKKEFFLEKGTLRQIVEHNGLFSKGLRFEHNNNLYPRFILFWAANIQELRSNLIARGFEVKNSNGCFPANS